MIVAAISGKAERLQEEPGTDYERRDDHVK